MPGAGTAGEAEVRRVESGQDPKGGPSKPGYDFSEMNDYGPEPNKLEKYKKKGASEEK